MARVVGLGRPRAKWLRGHTPVADAATLPRPSQRCQRAVKGKKQVDVSYAISSLPATDADARRLLSLSRGHWGIENRLHWVRDVTFDEDRSQVRTGAAPQVLAGLRNLVISLVRRAGHSNVAAALRRHNAHLSEAFDMMGFTYQAGE